MLGSDVLRLRPVLCQVVELPHVLVKVAPARKRWMQRVGKPPSASWPRLRSASRLDWSFDGGLAQERFHLAVRFWRDAALRQARLRVCQRCDRQSSCAHLAAPVVAPRIGRTPPETPIDPVTGDGRLFPLVGRASRPAQVWIALSVCAAGCVLGCSVAAATVSKPFAANVSLAGVGPLKFGMNATQVANLVGGPIVAVGNGDTSAWLYVPICSGALQGAASFFGPTPTWTTRPATA